MGQYNRTHDKGKQKTWHVPNGQTPPKPKRGAKVQGTTTTGRKGSGGFVFFIIFLGALALIAFGH